MSMGITTRVDELYELVKKKKKISLKGAAKRLRVKPETIEEWAKILEEEGLITFDYSLNPFAGGYLKVKEVEEKKKKR